MVSLFHGVGNFLQNGHGGCSTSLYPSTPSGRLRLELIRSRNRRNKVLTKTWPALTGLGEGSMICTKEECNCWASLVSEETIAFWDDSKLV
jgi:hypothetical protein